jgi:rsbT co-antagonist protein RsbR
VLADIGWSVNLLFDALGLYTTEAFQRNREAIILRQQEKLLEVSTPVVQLWKGILAVPLIGTPDSARTQIVMESLLDKLVGMHASIAIVDITGVPTIDTLVAQHLMKTVAAARLMGADCIISGIRPQIAQTIAHLGIDLTGIHTRSSLADAIDLALKLTHATQSVHQIKVANRSVVAVHSRRAVGSCDMGAQAGERIDTSPAAAWRRSTVCKINRLYPTTVRAVSSCPD